MCRIFVTYVTKGISIRMIVNLYRLCCEYDQMIGVNVGCDVLPSLEYIKFEPERQSEVVVRVQMVGECTGHIEVASADFIKGCDAAGKEAFLVRDVEAKALTHKDMGAHTGREAIVSFWVSVGFLCPKFVTENGVEIQDACQRFEGESLV